MCPENCQAISELILINFLLPPRHHRSHTRVLKDCYEEFEVSLATIEALGEKLEHGSTARGSSSAGNGQQSSLFD